MSKPSPRILIVRLSAIGDVVHGLPVANALRAALPSALIAWAVEGRAGDLLAGHSALDEVVRLKRGWLKSSGEVLKLRRRLKTYQFDVAIDLQGLSKSAICARLSGAKQRIGFARPDGREISTWLNNDLVPPTARHVVDRNLELLGRLGMAPSAATFHLPEAPADTSAAELIIERQQLAGGYAVINPGAGWPSKLWPPERFAAVARHLASACGLPSLVVWAGEVERCAAEQIVAEAPGCAQLAPSTTLTELAALARRARLFVASDTGPLHIAAAVGTPCVGLFGPMPAWRNGPFGPANIAVQNVCLAGSSRERRRAGPQSMQAISAQEVCAACDKLLARANTAKRCA